MEPAVDLTLHPAQPASQTLLVVNQILSQSAEQLNAFAATCEDKLIAMHHKMQRLETGVKLLEGKLNSIPSASGDAAPLGAPPASAAAPPPPAAGAADGAAPPQPAAATNATPNAEPAAEAPEAAPPPTEEPKKKIKDDPRFAKYFKMVNFGVPKPVVIMKFQQETGFDPALLDTPDAPAPLGGEDEDDADDDED